MKDTELERIALLSIIAGLALIILIMPKYEPIDAHYLTTDDNNAFLKGEIIRTSHNEESGWSVLEIKTKKTTTSFYEGKIEKNKGETIHIKGTYRDGKFTIEEYK